MLRGKQSTIRDFFMGGHKLPWLAVSGSIVATEISAITFIAVPATVFATGGNFTYLQWGIGSIIARVIVGLFFTKVFYERQIFSPYDYMESRLGKGTRTLTTWFFFMSTVLGQSVRLLVTALILKIVTPVVMLEFSLFGHDITFNLFSFEMCIVIIVLFAMLWTIMGGMTTVIWTEVIQFFIFVGGGILACGVLLASISGGLPEFFRVAGEAGKLKLIDLSTDPHAQFTLWTAIIAMPFQNLAAFGTDQLNAQRIFCCKSPQEAGKAVIFSSFSLLITVLMLLVGAGLYVFYYQNPPSEAELAQFAQRPDAVFPVWATFHLPAGVAGIVLAGAFAAAISSIQATLAALAQTTLSLFYAGKGLENADQKRLVHQSRNMVVVWSVGLIFFALGLEVIRGRLDLLSLAFGMTSYTYGPLLGTFLLALTPLKRTIRGAAIGAAISILLVFMMRPELYNILAVFHVITPERAKEILGSMPNFAWFFPITCIITFTFGALFEPTVRMLKDGTLLEKMKSLLHRREN